MATIAISTTSAIIGGETVNAVNARELWQYLESKRQFGNWIKDRIRQLGFIEGVDYTVNKIVIGEKLANFQATDYIISLDMAKHLAMAEKNEKGRIVRQYFIEVEKQSRAAAADPKMIADAIMEKAAKMMYGLHLEKARLEIENRLMRNYVPLGKPGEIAENGKPRTNLRRAYWTSGNGKPASMLLLERVEQPGLFEEIEVRQIQQARG